MDYLDYLDYLDNLDNLDRAVVQVVHLPRDDLVVQVCGVKLLVKHAS
jgi:hypothetical protein